MNEKELLSRLIKITGKENDSKVFLNAFKLIEKEKFALLYISPNSVFSFIQNILVDIKFLHSLELYPTILISKETKDYLDLFFKKQFLEEKDFEIIEKSKIDFINLKEIINQKKIPFVIIKSDQEIFSDLDFFQNNFLYKKIIYLDTEAPFLNHSQEKISIINLNQELVQIRKEDLLFFEKIKALVENSDTNFVYTSPITLLTELFTIKGAGSLIRKGTELEIYSSFNEIDIKKLKEVLEKSFRKKIKDSYFDKKIESLILEKNYKAGAIFFKTEFGIYLSKFLVDEIARGEGIGREIWDLMKKKYKEIFWRAKKTNLIHPWYLKECEGFFKTENWNFYSIGIPLNKFQLIEKYISNLEEDFL